MAFIRNTLATLVILGCVGGAYYVLTKNPCDAPIEYSLGRFDAKFGISKADFLADAAAAEKMWESAIGKDLFKYSTDGSLTINLMYDERQATADQNRALGAQVDQTQAQAQQVKIAFENLKARYESERDQYQALSAQLSSRLAAYNAQVDSWNKQGGAPASEYKKLQAEKADLQTLRNQVELMRTEVNSLADQVNASVSQYNALVKSENAVIHVINQSADREFEQGEYVSDASGRRINVYEFEGKTKLIRLLAHEMGHALGLDHNDDPDSIMYYLNKSQVMELSDSDLAALKNICRIK